MKKFVSLLLVFVLCAGLMAGCGGKDGKSDIPGNPFEGYNLADYVTFPDYDSYTPEEPGEITVTDDEIMATINELLASVAGTEDVTEGKVEKGDSIKISFKGTLADGTSPDGMQSDSTALTLGQGRMIAGFEESIYGATIGEPITAELQFPDPYELNADLSGKDVTFVITVLSKSVKVIPELNEDFVKQYSDLKTVEEYKAYIGEQLEESKMDERLGEIKTDIYNRIKEEAVVSQVIEEQVNAEIATVDMSYRQAAESQGVEWEKFLEETFQFDQAEYDAELKSYAETVVKEKMLIYAMAEKEGVKITQEEYDTVLNDLLSSVGLSDAEQFQQYMGVSLEEYAEMFHIKLNLVLDKTLGVIYDRIK
ncbi:MAG: FKBP-type peptidyl-prolyl cis-trans isomerase [Firmicutes bacterium]|nr:FKBP-type peptidyl-prolyl cis-trans isomerase [Bacillota bacterium]